MEGPGRSDHRADRLRVLDVQLRGDQLLLRRREHALLRRRLSLAAGRAADAAAPDASGRRLGAVARLRRVVRALVLGGSGIAATPTPVELAKEVLVVVGCDGARLRARRSRARSAYAGPSTLEQPEGRIDDSGEQDDHEQELTHVTRVGTRAN